MEQRIRAAQDFLLRVQHDDGGWPYRVGTQGSPEPTCYSLLALSDGRPWSASREIRGSSFVDRGSSDTSRITNHESRITVHERRIRQGLQWLQAHVNSSGAVTLDGDDEPHWSSSLLVITLTRLQRANALRERCVRWLLSWAGNRTGPLAAIPLNGQLRGWPWISDTFSWVEPTSYAILALKLSGHSHHPRVKEGEQLLLDRTCEGGGWNYGNRIVFGRALPAFIPPTALAALALQDITTARPIVDLGLGFLRRGVDQSQSALSLALTILCLSAFNQPTETLTEALLRRQQPDGSWRQATHLTALAALALESIAGGFNVFKL